MVKLLESLYSITGDWGIAIILFTLLVRVVTHPLTKKQMDSMQKMQRLQPQIKVLQEKFKRDKESLSRETMQLYKDNKVNPMAGCLPLLVQLPIFILLFQALNTLVSTEGFSATFFGVGLGESVYSTIIAACHNTIVIPLMEVGLTEEAIKNLVSASGIVGAKFTEAGLSEEAVKSLVGTTGLTEAVIAGLVVLKSTPLMDIGMFNVGYAVINNPAGLYNFSFYMANLLLLLVIAFLTWFQQKLTTSGNPQMAAMNVIMPLMLTWICFSLPGGVLLYWGTTSIVGVAHHLHTSKRTKKEMEEKPILYKDKPMGN